MVVISPAVLFGAADATLGILSSALGGAAQQQDYLNQKAFQDANTTFSTWQAGLNARLTDANSQFRYWTETVSYNQQLAYSHGQRNMELIRAARQAEVVGQTRAATGAAFVQDSQALSQAMAEASMQDAVAMQQFRWRALQGRATVQAMDREGQSVDRIVNDFARQQGDFETLQAINQRLRNRQYSREQAGQVAQYLSRWNSQQFYEEQPVLDPLPPWTPLPALLMPAPPSMTGSAPGWGATALNIGSSILDGFKTGSAVKGAAKSLAIPSSPTGPGTGR